MIAEQENEVNSIDIRNSNESNISKSNSNVRRQSRTTIDIVSDGDITLSHILNPGIEEGMGKISRQEKFNLLKLGVIAGFGGFFFGYNTAVMAGALSPISNKFDLTDIQKSLVVSLISLGSLSGCIIGGIISDKIGRWRTMILQNIFFLIAAIIICSSTNIISIYFGRLITGFGAAFSIVGDIPYLNEISPSKYRGRLSSCYEILVVIGTVFGSLSCVIFINVSGSWRIELGLPIIFIVIHSFFLYNLPESPRWLIQTNQRDKAKKSLHQIFLTNDVNRINSEIIHIENIISNHNITPNTSKHSNDKILSSILLPITNKNYELLKEYQYPIKLVIILMILSQFTGSVVIRNFAPTIFEDAGFSFIESLILNLVVSIVNSIFVIVSTSFLDKQGRKKLLLLGISITIIGTFILSIGFFSGEGKVISIYLTSCLLTTIGYSVGFGTVGWLLSSEMFPTKIRGQALSISTIARNTCEFISNFLFLLSIDGTSAGITFAIFCFLGFISFIFVYQFVIETKEKEYNIILYELLLKYNEVMGSDKINSNDNDISILDTQMNSQFHLNNEITKDNNDINPLILKSSIQ